MLNKLNTILLVLCSIGWTQLALAQSDGISPFSSLGLGDFYDANLIPVTFGGGLSAAFNDPYKVNVVNPASLGHLTTTAFEFGVSGQFNTLTEGGRSESVKSGNLSYISLSLPLINPLNEILENKKRKLRWGAQIALQPYTSVSYDISSAEFIDGPGTVRKTFIGDGNTYKLLMNHGFKTGNTAFGLSLGLLLGGIEYSELVNLSDQSGARGSLLENKYSVSGLLWNLGVQHDFYFGKIKEEEENRRLRIPKLTIGLTAHGDNSFNTTSDIQAFAISGSAVRDTASSIIDQKGNGTLPAEFNFGFNYDTGKKWTAGANLYLGNWSNYNNDGSNVDEPLSNSYRLSFGSSFLPNRNAIRNLLSRSIYKFGVFYGSDPRQFNGEQLKQYGANLGVELPFLAPRNFSFVNLGVEYGQTDVEALKNRYIKINLGLTFNSNQWFLKRKYN